MDICRICEFWLWCECLKVSNQKSYYVASVLFWPFKNVLKRPTEIPYWLFKKVKETSYFESLLICQLKTTLNQIFFYYNVAFPTLKTNSFNGEWHFHHENVKNLTINVSHHNTKIIIKYSLNPTQFSVLKT